jgi:hypothetical protein
MYALMLNVAIVSVSALLELWKLEPSNLLKKPQSSPQDGDTVTRKHFKALQESPDKVKLAALST